MQTYGNKRFIGLMRLSRKAPWKHRTTTTEIEYPWRVCQDSLIIRIKPLGWGIVTGIWEDNKEPWHESLATAIGARELDFEDKIEAPDFESASKNQDVEYSCVQ